jgi:hypothetical protein
MRATVEAEKVAAVSKIRVEMQVQIVTIGQQKAKSGSA